MADIAENGLNWHTLEVRLYQHQVLIEADVKAHGSKLDLGRGVRSGWPAAVVEARRVLLLGAGAVEGGAQ